MKIAIPYENGKVFGHFGHTEAFKLYETSDGKITKMEILSTDGQGHGALAGFLKGNGVDLLICGGIGGGAKTALANARDSGSCRRFRSGGRCGRGIFKRHAYLVRRRYLQRAWARRGGRTPFLRRRTRLQLQKWLNGMRRGKNRENFNHRQCCGRNKSRGKS